MMFEFFLFLLVIYLIWKIIKRQILRPPRKDFTERQETSSKFKIDKDQIEDANFKEIDKPSEKSSD